MSGLSIILRSDRYEDAHYALAIERIALPVLQRGRSHQRAQAAHGEEQHGRLVGREGGARQRERIMHALVVALAHDDR